MEKAWHIVIRVQHKIKLLYDSLNTLIQVQKKLKKYSL